MGSSRGNIIPDTESAENRIPIRNWVLEGLARLFLIAAVVAVFGVIVSFVLAPTQRPQVIAIAPPPIQTVLPTLVPLPTATPTVTPTPLPPPVALLAGHSGGADTGALCPDGLREVDITKDVVQRTKLLLELRGYRVDILAEFDQRLNSVKREYSPATFLSIHVDSCVYYASGYKVARASNSAIAAEDDRLVRCVTAAYGTATQLPFHAGSITTDMTQYHGLNEINPQSPGAIIELGFMGSDRDLLMSKREQIARGIADGLDKFLLGSACQ